MNTFLMLGHYCNWDDNNHYVPSVSINSFVKAKSYCYASANNKVVRPLSVRQITPVSRDMISLYLWFQWHLAQISITWVGIDEKVFKVGRRDSWNWPVCPARFAARYLLCESGPVCGPLSCVSQEVSDSTYKNGCTVVSSSYVNFSPKMLECKFRPFCTLC